MAPIILGLLFLGFCAFVFLGRNGSQQAGALVRRHAKTLCGYGLLGLAGLLTIRGLWEPALLPAALGWWLVSGGSVSGGLSGALKLYLDRRFPGWRQHMDPDVDARAKQGGRPVMDGVMTEQEAYEILGLQPGQSSDAIRAAYRTAVKKVHPDQGGSAEMAVRLNLARDFLLQRHA